MLENQRKGSINTQLYSGSKNRIVGGKSLLRSLLCRAFYSKLAHEAWGGSLVILKDNHQQHSTKNTVKIALRYTYQFSM